MGPQEFLQAPGREVLAAARDLDVRPAKLGALLERGILRGGAERVEALRRFVEPPGVEVDRGKVSVDLLLQLGGEVRVGHQAAESRLSLFAPAALEELARDLVYGRRVAGVLGLGRDGPLVACPAAFGLDEGVHPPLLRRRPFLPAALEKVRRDDDPRGRPANLQLAREVLALGGRNVFVQRHLVARECVERRGRDDERLHPIALAAVGLHEENQDASVLQALGALDRLGKRAGPEHFEAGLSGKGAARRGGCRRRGGRRGRRGGRLLGENEGQESQESEHRSLSFDYSRRATYNAQALRGLPLRKGGAGARWSSRQPNLVCWWGGCPRRKEEVAVDVRGERPVRGQDDLAGALDRHPRQPHVRAVERLRQVTQRLELAEVAKPAHVEEAVVGPRCGRQEEAAAAARTVRDRREECVPLERPAVGRQRQLEVGPVFQDREDGPEVSRETLQIPHLRRGLRYGAVESEADAVREETPVDLSHVEDARLSLGERARSIREVAGTQAEREPVVVSRAVGHEAEGGALRLGEPHEAVHRLVHRAVAADRHDDVGAALSGLFGKVGGVAGTLRVEEVAPEAGGIERGADAVAIPHRPALPGRGIEKKGVPYETDSKAPYNGGGGAPPPGRSQWPSSKSPSSARPS